MRLLKNSSKKIKYAFVLGRFSKKIGDKYQFFPIDNWQNELGIATKFSFDGAEWIISDYSNPIFNKIYLNDILKRFKAKRMIINSIYLDLIMHDPLHKISMENFKWLVHKLKNIQNKTKINRITFPIEEKCRFRYEFEKKLTIKKLNYVLKVLGKKSRISIETDVPIKSLKKLLAVKSLKNLGLLLDVGNIRANGYDIVAYIKNFSDKIFGVHIKYRDKFLGKSKILPAKFFELKILRDNMWNLRKLNDLTFQTFRSDNNFKTDMKKSIKNFNEIFKKK
jgi:hypothetical protein